MVKKQRFLDKPGAKKDHPKNKELSIVSEMDSYPADPFREVSKSRLQWVVNNIVDIICHIDDHYLGDFSHASHFVVIEKATESKFMVVDPMHGKKKWISEKTLDNAIQDLKNHIKMCPLVFYLN